MGQIEIPGPASGFRFERDGRMLLITQPLGKKTLRSQWNDDELPLRSVIVDADSGEVLSAGLPKFFNYQEPGIEIKGKPAPQSPESDRLDRALQDGEPVWFTEKMDGSLAIRSVIDGRVRWRTRGSMDFDTEFSRAIERTASWYYPILNDPEFEPGRSLLFEFISPEYWVIVNYERADLVLIGAVDHNGLRMADIPELQQLAEGADLRLVDLIELPRDSERMQRVVAAMQGREGIVARCDNGRVLLKLKSAEYLARHRLRFSLNAGTVRDLCEQLDVRRVADFEEYLAANHGDWELLTDVKPMVETYVRVRRGAETRFDELAEEVSRRWQEVGQDRKRFAQEYALNLDGRETAAAFQLLQGDRDGALAIIINQRTRRAFEEMVRADARLGEKAFVGR